MLQLENKLKVSQETINSPNLCRFFSERDLEAIAEVVSAQYESDYLSMDHWRRRNTAALDLAMQVQKAKSFPWPDCSNVTFPLVTVAALQFHSKAYPTLIDSPSLVKARIIGTDPDGEKAERASRVESFMSWQLLEQDESWEEDTDRSLLIAPIVGTCWKKSYYDGQKGHNVSELVLPQDLVLNYWAKRVGDATKTHVLRFDRNRIHSRIVSGTFLDVRGEAWYEGEAPQPAQDSSQQSADNRQGIDQPSGPDARTPFILLEQHGWLDLDGDGYAEPVIVTFEKSSHKVLRIVYRFALEEDVKRSERGEVASIHATEHFTKVPFIPSPDGGILDVGFGFLLGPTNESVNSAINQLFDAGTMANTAGGFLGRGAKLRGGVYKFSPFTWNRVDSTGEDLAKSIYPLPVREPSTVMFQLLALLIGYAEKISGAVDVTTGGNPGQNTPSSSMQEMVAQGQKVFAAIYKRMWRSLRDEFRRLYYFNGLYLPEAGYQYAGGDGLARRSDFLGLSGGVVPVADPTILSDQQRFMQMQALMNLAKDNPRYNQDVLNINYLKALKIPNIEALYYTEKSGKVAPSQPSEKLQVEQLKVQLALKELEWKKLQFIASLLEQRRLNEAKIVELYSQAAWLEQQAGGIDAANRIAEFQAKIDAIKTMQDSIDGQLSVLKGIGYDAGSGSANNGGGVSRMEGPPGDSIFAGMGSEQTGGPQGGLG